MKFVLTILIEATSTDIFTEGICEWPQTMLDAEGLVWCFDRNRGISTPELIVNTAETNGWQTS